MLWGRRYGEMVRGKGLGAATERGFEGVLGVHEGRRLVREMLWGHALGGRCVEALEGIHGGAQRCCGAATSFRSGFWGGLLRVGRSGGGFGAALRRPPLPTLLSAGAGTRTGDLGAARAGRGKDGRGRATRGRGLGSRGRGVGVAWALGAWHRRGRGSRGAVWAWFGISGAWSEQSGA